MSVVHSVRRRMPVRRRMRVYHRVALAVAILLAAGGTSFTALALQHEPSGATNATANESVDASSEERHVSNDASPNADSDGSDKARGQNSQKHVPTMDTHTESGENEPESDDAQSQDDALEQSQDETVQETSQPALQFNADGCAREGTATIIVDGRRITWDTYQQRAIGARGDCVQAIQRKMNTLCHNQFTVDGEFGQKTADAVREFQALMRRKGVQVDGNDIYVDGIVGPQTYALMHQFASANIRC